MTNQIPEISNTEIGALLSPEAFTKNYHKVLSELDLLHRGVFDEGDAEACAALCLLAQASLIKIHAAAEHKARALKRDIDFAKAEAYSDLRHTKGDDGKKLAEAALSQLLNKDENVHKMSELQNEAEREAKELSNILALLKDAHITFRALIKKGQ